MVRNIVFDIGNVLLDYHPITACHRHAQNPEDAEAIFTALFAAPEWAQKLDACLITEAEMLAIAQSRLATPEQKALCARVFADFHEDSLTPMKGMDQMIKSLHRRGFGLYVLSNTGERFYTFKQKIPCVDLFDGFLLSGEEKILKPSLEIFQRLCSRFSLKAAECLFIDDKAINVRGAEHAGMQGYTLLNGDVEALNAFLEELSEPRA